MEDPERDARPPVPTVQVCTSCGKPINPLTFECAGCSN